MLRAWVEGGSPAGLWACITEAREHEGNQAESAAAALLVRLRADRCFYADPPPRPTRATGRRAATAPS
jgi:hypothetical protein